MTLTTSTTTTTTTTTPPPATSPPAVARPRPAEFPEAAPGGPRDRRSRPRTPRGAVRLPTRGAAGRRHRPARAVVWLRRLGPITAVLALFFGSALIVPTMTTAAVGDDWVYARSVEILLREGELRILDLSVVTLVFQVFWGALFGLFFGETFGSLRLSTVVMTAIGGWALYALCRELAVDRGRAALGAAAYLFHPLAYVLGFSFMTDPHFAALTTLATFGYARGLRPGRPSGEANRALLLGAVAAACAFLVRQQGALIPLAVAIALLLGRRPRPDRASVILLLRIGGIPAVALIGYYLWLFGVNGVPEQQASFTERVIESGWGETWLLTWRLAVIEAMYVGFFALPLVVAAAWGGRRLVRVRSLWVWGAVAAWAALLAVGIRHFDAYGRTPPPMSRMPYVGQYVGPQGLGPADLVGGRPWLVGWWALDVLTAVCAVAALGYGLILARRIPRPRAPDATRAVAGVVLMVALGQVAGVLPPSFHFRTWIVSVDRYLLPLLPLALALALWALRGMRFSLGAGWTMVALFGLLSVAGTRDFLVLQGAIWDLARWTTAQGVALDRVDGGASWDGYRLYEYGLERGITEGAPGVPWWIDLFAPAIDATYVVATGPAPGYDITAVLDYSSWLSDEPAELYLLRRQGVPGPP